MQFIITKQIAVEAETPEEAVAKLSEGKTISLSVNPRPQQPNTQQSVAGSRIAGSQIPPHMAITKLPTTTTVQPNG